MFSSSLVWFGQVAFVLLLPLRVDVASIHLLLLLFQPFILYFQLTSINYPLGIQFNCLDITFIYSSFKMQFHFLKRVDVLHSLSTFSWLMGLRRQRNCPVIGWFLLLSRDTEPLTAPCMAATAISVLMGECWHVRHVASALIGLQTKKSCIIAVHLPSVCTNALGLESLLKYIGIGCFQKQTAFVLVDSTYKVSKNK